jgi:hypothetical protein
MDVSRGPDIVASDCSVLAQSAPDLTGELTDIETSARLKPMPSADMCQIFALST